MPSLPEPTLHDVLNAIHRLDERQTETLEAIQLFSTEVDRRFNESDKRMDKIEVSVDKLEKRIGGVEIRVGSIETRMGGIENRMVTNEYLDDKLFALRADLIRMAKRAEKRFEQLLEELVAEKSLKRSTADRLLAMGA